MNGERAAAALALLVLLASLSACSSDDDASSTTVSPAIPVGSCPLDAETVSSVMEDEIVVRHDCDFRRADSSAPEVRVVMTVDPFNGEPARIIEVRTALEDAFGPADDVDIGDTAFVVHAGLVSQLVVFEDRIEYRIVITAPDLEPDDATTRLESLFDAALSRPR